MNFAWLVGRFLEIINIFVYVVFALTFLVLVWKIIDAWVINGGDSNKASEAKRTIFFGIIMLVVMSSVWGIVAVLKSSIFGS